MLIPSFYFHPSARSSIHPFSRVYSVDADNDAFPGFITFPWTRQSLSSISISAFSASQMFVEHLSVPRRCWRHVTIDGRGLEWRCFLRIIITSWWRLSIDAIFPSSWRHISHAVTPNIWQVVGRRRRHWSKNGENVSISIYPLMNCSARVHLKKYWKKYAMYQWMKICFNKIMYSYPKLSYIHSVINSQDFNHLSVDWKVVSHPSLCPPIHPSTHLSIHPSTHPSINLSTHPFTHSPASTHPNIHPFNHPFLIYFLIF